MAETGDVVVYWSLVPTEGSVKSTAERIAGAINRAIGKVGNVSGGGMSKKQDNDSALLGTIAKGVLGANVALTAIQLIITALDPILKPILFLIRILVLLIFLPLFPFIKEGMLMLVSMVKIISPISKVLYDISNFLAPLFGFLLRITTSPLITLLDPQGTLDRLKVFFAGLPKINLESFGEFFVKLGKVFSDIWGNIVNLVSSIVQQLGSFGSWVYDSFVSAFTNIITVIIDAVNKALDLIRNIISNIPVVGSGIAKTIPSLGSNASSNVNSAFKVGSSGGNYSINYAPVYTLSALGDKALMSMIQEVGNANNSKFLSSLRAQGTFGGRTTNA